jgi:Family of unknown function (DUF6283)
MTATDQAPEIRRAVPELAALAVAVREDWQAADVRAVIANAAAVGMTWSQVLVTLPRLMADPQARPGELVPDHRHPLAPHRADPPNQDWHQARDQLNTRRTTTVADFPRRAFPCNECPWRRDAPTGRFSSCRYDALKATAGGPGVEAPINAPMFGCHKGEPGTNRDLACAGWLAVAGGEHLGVRLAVVTGRLSAEALTRGENWPELYGSYAEMAAANSDELPAITRKDDSHG